MSTNFTLFKIVRIRYNPETDDIDLLPTTFSTDTEEEARALCLTLERYDAEDAFTYKSA